MTAAEWRRFSEVGGLEQFTPDRAVVIPDEEMVTAPGREPARPAPSPIGPDIDLLCKAVEAAAAATSREVDAQRIQRKMHVGWVKAGRLLGLLDDYGVTEYGYPYHRVLITREQVAETQERLRQIAAKKQANG